MSTRALTVVLVALVATAVLWFVAFRDEGDHVPTTPSPSTTQVAEPGATGTRAEPTQREQVGDPSSPDASEPATEPDVPTETVRGVVVDTEGRPVVGIGVFPEGEVAHQTRTDAAGQFEVQLAVETRASLSARGDGYLPIRDAVVRPRNLSATHRIVVAPAVPAAGTVVDEQGAPIGGATITLQKPSLSAFPFPLDATRAIGYGTASGQDGRFDLNEVPHTASVQIVAHMTGYESASAEIPRSGSQALRLVLAAEKSAALTGWVRLPDGDAAAGARVMYANRTARADENGWFEIPIQHSRFEMGDAQLIAGKAGFGSAILPGVPELIEQAKPGSPEPVTITLRGDAPTITGRIVDADGAPQAGWTVMITDGTNLTPYQVPPVLLEGFGRESSQVETDDDGRFELTDLQDRNYTIRAYHGDSLLSVNSEDVPAGTQGHEIVLPADPTHDEISGIVLSRRGVALANATVTPSMVTYRTETGMSYESGTSVKTDENGRFTLRDVPRSNVSLDVGGDILVPATFEIPGSGVDNMRLEVAQRCHVRILASGNVPTGWSAQIRNAGGEDLWLYQFQDGSWSANTKLSIQGETSSRVVAVSEDGVELVITGNSDGKVLARQSVSLVPGNVQELHVTLP